MTSPARLPGEVTGRLGRTCPQRAARGQLSQWLRAQETTFVYADHPHPDPELAARPRDIARRRGLISG